MTGQAAMPDQLSPRHLRARLLQLAALVAVVVAVILAAPGLGELRTRLRHASTPWLIAGVALELFSALSYVLIFRAVFCSRMSWRISYEIGMAEQAANSLLPAGGAGGLALGAWALRQGGATVGHIARRTVAFFLLTSLANLGTLIVFAVLFAIGVLGHDEAPGVTYGFAGAAAAAIVLTLALPRLTRPYRLRPPSDTAGRLSTLVRRLVDAVADGVGDSTSLLVRRPGAVLTGSLGYMAFDIAVLGVCYRAIGNSPGIGVLVVAYIVGQLGGLLPVPGGIGGTEGGLIGVFLLFGAPLASTTVAVLAYRAIQLWVPAVLGSIAFVQLRHVLRQEPAPAVICEPLAEPVSSR